MQQQSLGNHSKASPSASASAALQLLKDELAQKVHAAVRKQSGSASHVSRGWVLNGIDEYRSTVAPVVCALQTPCFCNGCPSPMECFHVDLHILNLPAS